jgi:hypothetical protein
MKPNKTKQTQAKWLWFPWFYSSESRRLNGLQRIQIENFSPRYTMSQMSRHPFPPRHREPRHPCGAHPLVLGHPARQRGLEECSSWRPVSRRQNSGAFDNLLARRFAPPGPPIAFVGANRRMHAIQAELFHEVTLTRHICLGVIHRVPHAPIAACCAGSRLCGPAQTFRWRSPAPARRAGRQAARAAPARLADLVRSSQGDGGAAGEREGRADRLAGRQWGRLPGQGGRRSDANGVWPVGHSRRQRQYPTLGEDRSSQSAAMSLSVSAF